MRFFFMNSDSGNPASGKGSPKPKTPFYLPKQIFALLFFWVFSVSLLTAQTEQEQNVAKQYLEQGEFQKALAFYERFYQQRPESPPIRQKPWPKSILGSGRLCQAFLLPM